MVDIARIRKFFERDALAKLLGIELLDVSPGFARVQMDVGADHVNAIGTTHGGTIFSLADFAFAVASNSHGTMAVAMNVNISFVKATGTGKLYAEARELSTGNRVRNYTVTVTDEGGEMVALFQGMAYRKREPIEWPHQ
ncbi:MAG: hotdog fold thioesterase [Planctomycetes bacterium]|nr:hotdog fold thioesterase [Planctomycetota bacterium]